MTVQELISRLFDRIQSGELKGSDPVPADLFEDDVLERYGVTEYIAKKYGMEGDDKDGEMTGAQKDMRCVLRRSWSRLCRTTGEHCAGCTIIRGIRQRRTQRLSASGSSGGI